MEETILRLTRMQEKAGLTAEESASSLNFAVTDGLSTVVSRARSHPLQDPPSLYYSFGLNEDLPGDLCPRHKTVAEAKDGPLIVGSEPLSHNVDSQHPWKLLPKDSLLLATGDEDGLITSLRTKPLNAEKLYARWPETPETYRSPQNTNNAPESDGHITCNMCT